MLRWAVYFFLLSFFLLRLYVYFVITLITLITYLSSSSSSSSSLEEELLHFQQNKDWFVAKN